MLRPPRPPRAGCGPLLRIAFGPVGLQTLVSVLIRQHMREIWSLQP
jgi:hypothetical protein